MDRPYSSGQSKDVVYFVGSEVEALPTKDMKTLFVATIQDILTNSIDHIVSMCEQYDCKSVYLGANHVFKHASIPFGAIVSFAEELTDTGLFVIVDWPYSKYFQYMAYPQIDNEKVIFMISVETPSIEKQKNLFVKLDDVTFNHSNRGVWVTSPSQIEKQNGFNDWTVYTKDTEID